MRPRRNLRATPPAAIRSLAIALLVAMLEVNDAFFALGFGGQFVFVVPHLELVVVSTAANFADDTKQFFGILRQHIFPALRQ